MPTITDNYDFIGDAIEGQPASGVSFISRDALNETGAVLAYGRALVWDAGNSRYGLPSATGQPFKGIIKRTTIYENATDAQSYNGFPDGRMFDYIPSGDIWVYVETAVNPGSPVFFRHTANGAGKDVIGRFRADNDGASSTVDEITTGASWVDSYPANGFAKLHVDVA